MTADNFRPISAVDGALLLTRPIYEDDRGHFREDWRESWGSLLGLPPMVQHNSSFSFQGVLRGMHLQRNNPQGKLVSCAFGTIRDVLFDLRKDSPTFMRGWATDLAFDEGEALYIPPGVAHGFLVLSRYAVVQYSCTTYHDPASDGGVHWESPEVETFFPIGVNPTVSAKDRQLPTVREYLLKGQAP